MLRVGHFSLVAESLCIIIFMSSPGNPPAQPSFRFAICGCNSPMPARKQVFLHCGFVARLSSLGITTRQNTHFIDTANRHIRNYRPQVLLEPVSRPIPQKEQVLSLPPIRELSSLGRSLKSESDESGSKSQKFKHPRKNWQAERRHKLTASTFAGAVGFWPGRRVQLWEEKIGEKEPFSGNLATDWNNVKEDEAVERYELITGNSVQFPEFQVYGEKYPEDDWLAASPDGVIDSLIYGLPSRGVLEIKCPVRQASPWKRIPIYYIPQAQGLMEILDRDWMDFYVWTKRGSSLFRIPRDEEYWGALKLALSDFWLKHVEPARDISSKNRIKDPLTQLKLKSLEPEPKHELFDYLVWESIRIVDSSKLLVREIGGVPQN